MDKIFVHEKNSLKIEIIETPLFTYLKSLPKNKQFIVYHVEEEAMEEALKEYKKRKKFPFSTLRSDNYLLTNDRSWDVYKVCDYNDIEKDHSYLIRENQIQLVNDKAFVYEAGSCAYTCGLQIYTTKTYEEVMQYFKKRQIIYEEIIKEMSAWSEEKRTVFQEMYTPIQPQKIKK